MASALKDYSIPTPPLPSQFLYAPKESTPERRLLAAVLEDAARILWRGRGYYKDRKTADTYRDAVAWIKAKRDPWPFCFVALCEALGFDADSMRARLLSIGRRNPPFARLR